jgi:hypothetical protein
VTVGRVFRFGPWICLVLLVLPDTADGLQSASSPLCTISATQALDAEQKRERMVGKKLRKVVVYGQRSGTMRLNTIARGVRHCHSGGCTSGWKGSLVGGSDA